MPLVQQAGAIAARVRGDAPEFLLVTAKQAPDDWIFPKGHIKRGETPEAAALRELEEEAGVHGAPIGVVGVSRFQSGNEEVAVTYFLIQAAGDGEPREGRQLRWLPLDAARRQISFRDAGKLLERAAGMLKPA